MDYMEAAAQLGQAIANSSEMKAWKDAEAALMEDEKGNTLMEEYRDAQMKMVRASREGLGQEEIEKCREMLLQKQRELNEYELTKNYFHAKDVLENMMRNINDVVSFYVNGSGGGCSGSCSGCSGC
jgi:cell fate (sporulation/competence/biofilm development) regulator YlbF (YheA/YmcA/DUF963 family)